MNINDRLSVAYAALWHRYQFVPTSRKRGYLRDRTSLDSEEALLSAFSHSEIRSEVECFEERLGGEFSFTTKFSESYPALLKVIPDPPPVLYFMGNMKHSISVAVVGSRNPSRYGTEVATTLSRDLVRLGITVTSGLARGIDSAAHDAAVVYGPENTTAASTIAVLGCGLEHMYPRENQRLAEEILSAGGCLVSELPLDTAPRPHYFPLRNRLISGLSEATVIIEARERSGSLITARTALEQGREVLVVPGKIDSESFRGSNGLLRDGARPYLDITDLFACLSSHKLLGSDVKVRSHQPMTLPLSVTIEESAVLSALQESEELTVEELINATGLTTSTIATAVTSLTIRKILREMSGSRYAKN